MLRPHPAHRYLLAFSHHAALFYHPTTSRSPIGCTTLWTQLSTACLWREISSIPNPRRTESPSCQGLDVSKIFVDACPGSTANKFFFLVSLWACEGEAPLPMAFASRDHEERLCHLNLPAVFGAMIEICWHNNRHMAQTHTGSTDTAAEHFTRPQVGV